MKTTLLWAAAASLLASAAFAHDDPTPPMSPASLEQTRPRTDAFFQTLRAGDPAKAYRDLFAGTLLETTKASEVSTLVAQTQTLLDAYGTLTGWTVMRSDCLTPTVCRIGYQVDMKNGPMFVFLLVHRRAGDWYPHWIYLTDVAQPLFEVN
jgi:hypothetical protein